MGIFGIMRSCITNKWGSHAYLRKSDQNEYRVFWQKPAKKQSLDQMI